MTYSSLRQDRLVLIVALIDFTLAQGVLAAENYTTLPNGIQYTSDGKESEDGTVGGRSDCVNIYNPRAGSTWANNYLCGEGIKFGTSQQPQDDGLSCIPFEFRGSDPNWDGSWLCWPKLAPYKIVMDQFLARSPSPPAGDRCLNGQELTPEEAVLPGGKGDAGLCILPLDAADLVGQVGYLASRLDATDGALRAADARIQVLRDEVAASYAEMGKRIANLPIEIAASGTAYDLLRKRLGNDLRETFGGVATAPQ